MASSKTFLSEKGILLLFFCIADMLLKHDLTTNTLLMPLLLIPGNAQEVLPTIAFAPSVYNETGK